MLKDFVHPFVALTLQKQPQGPIQVKEEGNPVLEKIGQELPMGKPKGHTLHLSFSIIS
jgi:hypothetical protein